MKAKLLFFGVLTLASIASAATNVCQDKVSGKVVGTDQGPGFNLALIIDDTGTLSGTISNPLPVATNLVLTTNVSSEPGAPGVFYCAQNWGYVTPVAAVYTLNAGVAGGGAGAPGYSTFSITIGDAAPLTITATGSTQGEITNRLLDLQAGTAITMTLLSSISGFGQATLQLGNMVQDRPMVVGGSNTGPVCAQGEKGCNP
jgi:hypothetical protein